MIIYGTRTPHLRSQNIAGQCRSCGTNNSLQLNVYQKYVHVFWIPFFPIGKAYQTVCTHCKNTLLENEVKDYYRTAYEDMKNQLSTPLWTFSGLGVVALLIVFFVISQQKRDKENREFIEAPQVGDVYEYKTDNNLYSLLKVAEITGDTVYVFPSNYGANKISGLTKLKNENDSTYSDEAYPLTKDDLKKKLEKNEILNVIRK